REITYALQEDIFCFNCESLQELEVLNALALGMGTTARIALRINPDVNANTHRYITTGLEETKVGINGWELPAVLERLRQCPNLKLIGLHFHIGSQITDLSTFRNLCNRVNEIHRWFLDHHIRVEHLNVGGGLGVDYQHPDDPTNPNLEAYFRVFHDFLEVRPRQTVHFELGRALVARCGNLIARVLYIKEGIQTNFAILDAGMTELIRPALYQAVHHIQNLSRPGEENTAKYDVVGPICESSDCFGKAVSLPQTQRGDLVAIRTAGAYGQVMASGYNLRDAVPAVYSDAL
ncbi:MAG: diaminopimelate decarboxylase, partial [Bacteroidota bacterium]